MHFEDKLCITSPLDSLVRQDSYTAFICTCIRTIGKNMPKRAQEPLVDVSCTYLIPFFCNLVKIMHNTLH